MAIVHKIYNTHRPVTSGLTPNFIISLPEKLKESIRNLPCGIEVEVESTFFPAGVPKLYNDHWITTKDGSLRNEGMEFVLRIGRTVGHLPEALNNLFEYFSLVRIQAGHPQLYDFSERTSIHVHLDINTFNEGSMSNLMVLYTLYEDQLFKYCASSRKENIFCVPLRNSSILSNINDDDTCWSVVNKFSKYCAFNLEATGRFGSVEFRHLEGTNDAKKILDWVILLSLLRRYAERTKPNVLREIVFALKSESAYEVLTRNIFSTFAPAILQRTDPQVMDAAVSDSKCFFFGEE